MREILFRGQMRRKGEKVTLDGRPLESCWVQGSGVLTYPGYETDRAIIYNTEGDISKYPVYADTIGQYTGVKCMNGKQIFEGDICEWTFNHEGIYKQHKGTIVYADGSFFAKDFVHGNMFCLAIFEDPESDIEIIGNIHDNPEMVKE